MRSLFIRALLLASLAAAGSAQAASLTASPLLVAPGASVTATWDAVPPPMNAWMALYNNPATGDGSYISYRYTTGTASGSVPFTIPASAAPGTYHLRLFYNGWTKIATSNTFKVGWTVTGTVTLDGSALAGVTFSASNGGTCGASNASGQYTCVVPAGWSGTVAPASTATHGFVPASRSYTNVTSVKTAQNYAAAPLQSYVSGVVSASGAPLPGVAFSATNGAVCTTSDASGQYTCGMVDGWSGTVTPSLSGYIFDPQSRAYSNLTAAQPAQDYLAVVSHNISGTVTNAGAALPGVALAASSGGACSASDGSGQYTCVVPTGWSGTVTPSLGTYAFTPASRAYSGVTTDQTAQDYAGVEFFQLSGTITASGSPLAGVSLTATGGTCTQTNASGQYTCSVAEGSTGTVIPAASGYLFVPAARSYGNLSAPQTGNHFAGTLAGASAPIYYIHADHLNTPRLVANSASTAVWQHHNTEPFGDSVPDGNPSGLGGFQFPLRFPGQYTDGETGLFQNWNRDYWPGGGRYVESDPIGLNGGLNTYSYVLGSPLLYSDPEGLFDPTGWSTAAAVASGVAASTVAAGAAGVAGLVFPSGIANENVPSDRDWRKKRKRWLVYVRCNVNKQPNCENCPDTIGGKAFGDTFPEANAFAQMDANANLGWQGARGCQARHCHAIKCFENGREVRCPTWN